MSREVLFAKQPGSAASWEPNFRPAVSIIAGCLAWLYLLCLTLPSRGLAWHLVRLASFPALIMTSFRLILDRSITLGNPLRDLVLPILTWTIVCKAAEICCVYAKGGPRPIRPFRAHDGTPVASMEESALGTYDWRVVDTPKLASWGRVLYALDVFFLRRVGTSLIRASEGRALEWSQRGLNDWARYLRANRCKPSEIPAHSRVRRFGQPEMPFYAALLQLGFSIVSLKWIYRLAAPSSEVIDVMGFYVPVASPARRHALLSSLPPNVARHITFGGFPPSIASLPMPMLLFVVMTVGGAVCLLPAVLEGVLLLFWKPKPATSFLASFERPVTAPGLARLWARSWHSTSQRDYIAMASLLPGSGSRPLQLLYVFFWSGVQHSMMFARHRIPAGANPSVDEVVAGMLDVGMIGFFVSQGVGILLEKAVLEALPLAWRKQHTLVAIARRAWMYAVLLGPGCFFVHSILHHRIITKDVLDGFSTHALSLMLQGKMYHP